MRLRIREHFQEIKHGGTSLIAEHFRNHNDLHSFKFFILHSHINNKDIRCKLEYDEILKHKSFAPMGLNQRKPANYDQISSKQIVSNVQHRLMSNSFKLYRPLHRRHVGNLRMPYTNDKHVSSNYSISINFKRMIFFALIILIIVTAFTIFNLLTMLNFSYNLKNL